MKLSKLQDGAKVTYYDESVLSAPQINQDYINKANWFVYRYDKETGATTFLEMAHDIRRAEKFEIIADDGRSVAQQNTVVAGRVILEYIARKMRETQILSNIVDGVPQFICQRTSKK